MARFLVSSPDTVAGAAITDRILDRLASDGHVATALDSEGDVLQALRASDAAIVVLDGELPAAGGAILAYAATQHKPTMGLMRTGSPLPRTIRQLLTTQQDGDRVEDWLAALPDFYAKVRPFAGRLVRDFIPDLVKEAGHDVTFRALGPDEKPRFLKEKVLAEAAQLRDADMGAEKEEIADILETLETLIRARDYDRDALKQIKDAKRKRRGGFERGWVVEETHTTSTDRADAPEDDAPTTPRRTDEAHPPFTL